MSTFHGIDFDAYEVLGVSITANFDTIRKAYRKKALEYHPDKHKDADDSHFIKVNQAYQILSDPNKRKVYDVTRQQPTLKQSDFQEIIRLFISILCKTFANVPSTQEHPDQEPPKPQQPTKPQQTNHILKKSLKLNVPITLEEMYRGDFKKVKVKVRKQSNDIWDSQILYIQCSECEHEKPIVFENKGDAYYNDNNQLVRGDIVIVPKIETHPLVKINKDIFGYDLFIERPLSLYHLYFGISEELAYFNDETIKVEKDNFMSTAQDSAEQSHVVIIPNKGLPKDDNTRGDLYIFYKLQLPSLSFQENIQSEIKTFLQTYFTNGTQQHNNTSTDVG